VEWLVNDYYGDKGRDGNIGQEKRDVQQGSIIIRDGVARGSGEQDAGAASNITNKASRMEHAWA
jgi:hypothetical protein